MPYGYFYEKKVEYYNKAVYNILRKEIPMILPNFRKERGILTS